jgi:hypothetical protein
MGPGYRESRDQGVAVSDVASDLLPPLKGGGRGGGRGRHTVALVASQRTPTPTLPLSGRGSADPPSPEMFQADAPVFPNNAAANCG